MEPFEPGARVERCNSPKDSPIKDGVRATVVEAIQAANGEMGYFVRVGPGDPPVFCAGSRLRAVAQPS